MVLRWLVLVASIFLALALFLPLNNLSFGTQNWLADDNLIEVNKRYLDEEFNQGERLVLLLPTPNGYFQQDIHTALHTLETKLRDVPHVSRTQSPASAQAVFKDAEGVLHNISYHKALKKNILAWEEYAPHLQTSPYWGRLIATNTKTIALVLTLDIVPGENNYTRRAVVYDAIKKQLATSPFDRYYFSGETELLHRLDIFSQQDIERLLPMAVAVLALALSLLYRRLVFVAIALAVILVNALVTFNIMQLIGRSFNLISANVPLLTLVIAIADSIHIIRRWQLNQHVTKLKQRCLLCWQETWLPCLFTSLTSAIGFGAFVLSDLLPLKYFGEASFICILAAYPVIMFGNLALLYVFAPIATQWHKTRPQASWVTAETIAAHKYTILGITALLLLGALAVSPQATTKSSFLDAFFSPDSKTAAGFKILDTDFSGSGGVDIILQSDQPESFKSIDAFNDIQTLTHTLGEMQTINSVESLLEPVAMVHRPLTDQATRYPQSEDALAQELLFLEFSRSDKSSDVLSQSVDFSYQSSRIHLYTPHLSAHHISDLMNQIRPLLSALPYTIITTGINVYFQQLSSFVLDTQLSSILFTGTIIFLGFVLLFGIRLGSIGALAGFAPIAIVLGAQIALGIAFDFATVLVASVSLGLCIDNISHLLHRFRYYTKQQLSTLVALQTAIADLQQPITITSLLLILGFLVLYMSNLVVIQQFALLTTCAILLSLVSVFILLPALLAIAANDKKANKQTL